MTAVSIRPQAGSATPELIVRVASGFMAAKHLFAASEFGIFEALADAPATLDALAARTGLTARSARISADAMVALGLLEREDHTYRNTPAAATFLAGVTPADLRPFLRFWDKVSYPAWIDLATALGRGPTREMFDLDESLQEIASAGIEAIQGGSAAALANGYDFSRHRKLLDIGGGTGSWSLAAARAHPQLKATVFELAQVADIARRRIAAEGMSSRVNVVAGDAMRDPLPSGHDVFLLANVVHYWSHESNRKLLTRVRDAATEGARILIADFWTDAAHTEPVICALMAGEFAVHVREGDVYSVDEAREWLDACGWNFIAHEALAGPVSVVIGEAV